MPVNFATSTDSFTGTGSGDSHTQTPETHTDDEELDTENEEDTEKSNEYDEKEVEERKLTIKYLISDGKIYTQAHKEDLSISELKNELVNIFNIPTTSMVLKMRDNEQDLSDEEVLKSLLQDEYGILEMTLISNNPEHKINVDYAYRDFTVPDVITVRVQTQDEGIKDVVVEIENRCIVKPFLGGYLDRDTGIEYHHGYSQTGPRKPKVPPERLNHRDTQTYFTRNRRIEMDYAQATQMSNEETWINPITDKILTAGPYETADEREKRLDIEGKVRIIQRYFRAWKMRKALKELSAEYHKRLRMEADREKRDLLEDVERKKRDLISRVFPRTCGDFSMLYSMTERWKKAEIARIRVMHCGPARVAEFYLLLEKEVEILRSIDALKQKMKQDRKVQKEINFFKTIGDPVRWISEYKNIPISMDTLWTQKGREYHALYEKICDINCAQHPQAQIDTLVELRALLEPHNCLISNELITLIDRECELLARGFRKRDMGALQRRIEGLLLRHIETPECNEGVTDRMYRMSERGMKDNLLYCHGCYKLKPIECFGVEVRTKEHQLKMCSTCKFVDKSKEPWIDISPYRFMLRQIRKTERLLNTPSSVAFILQEKDIYYIVTHIWHSHSALSECDDIYQLRLCRWIQSEPWAPWNCILLTADEAKAHMKIANLTRVYDENFINHIFNKHALARKCFAQLLDVEKCVQQANYDLRAVEKQHSDCSFTRKIGTDLEVPREIN